MWSNGFSYTIDIRRRGNPAVLLVVLAGLVAGSAAVWAGVSDPVIRVAILACGFVSAMRAVLQEWPASPLFVRRVIAGTDRRWRLVTGSTGAGTAELVAAWVVGPLAALAFRTADGRRRAFIVLKRQLPAADWRRFRVRIRHP